MDFLISASTLSTILKNRNKIKKLFEQGKGIVKKNRMVRDPSLEKCLIKWFKQCRDYNFPLGGNVLKDKAKQFPKKVKHKGFKSSNGWQGTLKMPLYYFSKTVLQELITLQ